MHYVPRNLAADIAPQLPCVAAFLSTVFSVVMFFFSSRRRHTRSLCDWSSDVCSSDLDRLGSVPLQAPRSLCRTTIPPDARPPLDHHHRFLVPQQVRQVGNGHPAGRDVRSEERRVGKEGRSRWDPTQYVTRKRKDYKAT